MELKRGHLVSGSKLLYLEAALLRRVRKRSRMCQTAADRVACGGPRRPPTHPAVYRRFLLTNASALLRRWAFGGTNSNGDAGSRLQVSGFGLQQRDILPTRRYG